MGEKGHGREWARVFGVDGESAERVWQAIAGAVRTAPITELREGTYGLGCGVLVSLTIGARVSPVLTGWHYSHESAAPRLVTAYPRIYNRGHGTGT